MDRHGAGEPPHVPFLRSVRRSVVLVALGTGVWLAGEATAAAEEHTQPPAIGDVARADAGAVAAAADELVASATSPHAGSRPGARTGSAAASVPAAEAPVVPVPVAPVVSAAVPVERLVTAPIAVAATPVGHVAQPVREVAARVRDVVPPVVGQVVSPIAETVERGVPSVAEPVERIVPPVTEAAVSPTAAHRSSRDLPSHGRQSRDAGRHGTTAVLVSAVDDSQRPAEVAPRGPHGVSPAAGFHETGSDPLPVPPRTPAAGGPVGARCSGAHSADQPAADLPAAVVAMTTAALAASREAHEAAGGIASDPSFSPD